MYKILKNTNLKRLLAFVFILIFALSNTPKKALHNIFANHSDILKFESVNTKLILTKAEFHCNCDNLVVINPFIFSETVPPSFTSVFYSEKRIEKCNDLPFFQKIFFELRGPPSLA